MDQLVRERINNGTQCRVTPGKEGGQDTPSPLTFDQIWGVFAILGSGEFGPYFCYCYFFFNCIYILGGVWVSVILIYYTFFH